MADSLHQVRESLKEAIKREGRLRRKERKLRDMINKFDVPEPCLPTPSPQTPNPNFFQNQSNLFLNRKSTNFHKEAEKHFLRKARTLLLPNQRNLNASLSRNIPRGHITHNFQNLLSSQPKFAPKMKTQASFSKKERRGLLARTFTGLESRAKNRPYAHQIPDFASSEMLRNFSSKISNEILMPKKYYLVSNLQGTRATSKSNAIKSKSLDVAKQNAIYSLPQTQRES